MYLEEKGKLEKGEREREWGAMRDSEKEGKKVENLKIVSEKERAVERKDKRP
jgi:hypothetical protein